MTSQESKSAMQESKLQELNCNCNFLCNKQPQDGKYKDLIHNFGILSVGSEEQEIQSGDYHFVANCDRSGSMMEETKDNKSKMEHLLHTLKNMIIYFAKLPEDVNIYLTVIAFDDRTEVLFSNELITKDNQKTLINMLDELTPRGMTDIESAIKCANKYIDDQKEMEKEMEKEKNQKFAHILLTDGNITKGDANKERLKNLLHEDCNNIFVGYGIDHNEVLLQELSAGKKSDYYFIESLENAGMVYGEIVHGTMYETYTNISIEVENGEIYNFEVNEWGNKLEIPNLPSGVKKTYHIREKWDNAQPIDDSQVCEIDELSFRISYHNVPKQNNHVIFNVDIAYPLPPTPPPDSEDESNSLCIDPEVLKFWYRQQTQELMFETRILMQARENIPAHKLKLKDFLTTLKTYMKENELEDDEFMKTLCDDIYVSLKSLDSHLGNMYLGARSLSQGKQRAYNIQNLDELIRPQNDYFSGSAYGWSGSAVSGGMGRTASGSGNPSLPPAASNGLCCDGGIQQECAFVRRSKHGSRYGFGFGY